MPHGLPIQAYRGADCQSDREAARPKTSVLELLSFDEQTRQVSTTPLTTWLDVDSAQPIAEVFDMTAQQWQT